MSAPRNDMDGYLNFANGGFGKTLFGLLGLPIPPILKRADTDKPHVLSGAVLLGAADKLSASVLQALPEMEKLSLTGLDGTQVLPENQMGDRKLQGLVFDASGIKSSADLKALHTFFNVSLRSLARCGRVVVLGLNPDSLTDPLHATAQRALMGFTKSVAKEIGRKGATANLIYQVENSGSAIESPVRFFLSHRSAYVNGQVVRVGAGISETSEAWEQPLAGKTALVTGASRGIGGAIAQVLARDGAKVVGLDVPQAETDLKIGMDAIGGEVLALNITDERAPKVIAEHFSSGDHSGVDIVVHNAGITRDKMLSRMPEQHWNLLMDINLSSIERINQELLDSNVLNEGGRIIGVSSISGIAGNVGQTNYAASKSGVIGMVESNKEPLASKKITINAVAPGFIETQMTAAIPFMTRQFGRRLCSLYQGGLPVDVAETIAFFAAPQSQGLSGNVVRVCGQNIMGA